MMKLMILLIAATICTGQDGLPSILEVIEDEGQFVFTDGSSTYQFYDDGSFFLEPTSLCGRAVEGSWEWLDSGRMEITGTWSWYNGISAINDLRTMRIYMYLRSMETEDSALLWRTSDSRFYDVYFTIEEIVPIQTGD